MCHKVGNTSPFKCVRYICNFRPKFREGLGQEGKVEKAKCEAMSAHREVLHHLVLDSVKTRHQSGLARVTY